MDLIQYDIVIVDAGRAGVPLVKKLTYAGEKVIIIEKWWFSRTYVNDGYNLLMTLEDERQA
ncbi:hypothetical protein GCM10023231_13730 [Olivibacter ginsenosidimutans]|uniref:FAD-binding protein n=1 Tax=Olivibacter ginsenosidimutans TaxID=1176537 RepID=A0ABP9AWZ7_9SPHI